MLSFLFIVWEGLGVSLIALFSDGPSSNPAEIYCSNQCEHAVPNVGNTRKQD